MNRALAVLRPEPGNAATVARIEALEMRAMSLPLFEVAPLAWTPPDAQAHDALILTSANALRHGGVGLAALRALPVFAVGAVTAAAARKAGFRVVAIGAADAATLLAQAETHGVSRALYLGGRDRMVATGGIVTAAIAVYASLALPIRPERIVRLRHQVALLHSVRAARAFAGLVGDRAAHRIAALSPAILAAAEGGWDRAVSAAVPTDDALIAAAAALAD
ncbi:uroporphyrinogen-III synthase [Sphingomonas sp. Leaf357]|uniref:uroporphyrinogen-III synthase n=1 Tax=Sphingomonas sp. Leaf357 TaxID=1736350 RepID=UPI0006FFD3D0|nr:uroporphyrinogen-III synthase [Sphingomonas sp. Leaf357]KQS03186.1 uroporphyrinogen-III synthase [Sphingomonas sp. Leaf357]